MTTILALTTARFSACATCFLLVLVCGCSRSDRPPLAPVAGTVTLDGQPLAKAAVTFRPAAGRASRGFTDEEGHYELIYIRDIRGAKVGSHTVIISTRRETVTEEMVPEIYNKQTTLTAEVDGRKNVINFDLETPGKE
jgi:hypothetical protein